MLSIASCLVEKHDVSLFWNPQQTSDIKQKAKEKLGIDLSLIRFSPNIFSPHVSLISRLKSSKNYDAIIYLSDGSIPFVWSKLYLHFQFPVEWVNGRSLKTKLKLLKVHGIFCNSQFTKKYIDKTFSVQSRVLYPPVEIHVPKRMKKENIILHVGRFATTVEGSNYKKQDVMIGVFKKMVDAGLKNWEFSMVIGYRKEDMDKVKELKKLAKGYPIIILENPLNTMLWEQYTRAKIYWHAAGFGEDLKKHPERAEHFGISTVEAMGAGAVPVVINAGGQPEIVHEEENGFLWENIDELIEKTKRLMHDEKLWEKMSKKAQKRGQFFAGDKFCKELKGILEV